MIYRFLNFFFLKGLLEVGKMTDYDNDGLFKEWETKNPR